jgi:EAL domain-containing protein (putative c-di-GMP-specific phosphodiesterase class I)
VASRIVQAILRPVRTGDDDAYVGASIGIAMADQEVDPIVLFRNADIAMYAAKREGKGQYVVYTPALDATDSSTSRVLSELTGALERDELLLLYQPIIDAETGRIVCAEALIRWLHPEHGLIAPPDFILLAEASRLAGPISRWVLREACAQARVWRLSDPALSNPRVSVNISPRQLQEGDLAADTAAALAETGLPASALIIELTESQMTTSVAEATDQIHRLHQLGVSIAVDDFGSGYSALGHLQRLPADYVKLDKSFVDDVDDSARGQQVVGTVVRLCQTLSIVTVAEGVETEEQAAALRALGVDLFQGSCTRSRPNPACCTTRCSAASSIRIGGRGYERVRCPYRITRCRGCDYSVSRSCCRARACGLSVERGPDLLDGGHVGRLRGLVIQVDHHGVHAALGAGTPAGQHGRADPGRRARADLEVLRAPRGADRVPGVGRPGQLVVPGQVGARGRHAQGVVVLLHRAGVGDLESGQLRPGTGGWGRAGQPVPASPATRAAPRVSRQIWLTASYPPE